jgi:hypothetical protein
MIEQLLRLTWLRSGFSSLTSPTWNVSANLEANDRRVGSCASLSKSFRLSEAIHQHLGLSSPCSTFALDDRPPLRLPSRLIEALTLFPNRVIELVMNDADQGNLEDLLLEIVIRHNIHYGRHKAEHIRRTLNDRTNIRELSELFSQHFRQQLKHQLFILEIIKGVDSYWDLFIWTQLTSFLKDILPTTRVLILNYNSESLNLKDVEVSVFLYQAGLA